MMNRAKCLLPYDAASIQRRYELARKLRERGMSYSAISRALGYADASGAFILLTKGQCARQAAHPQPQVVA